MMSSVLRVLKVGLQQRCIIRWMTGAEVDDVAQKDVGYEKGNVFR
jgi:hypothetical protein